jgi:hypothetical protein
MVALLPLLARASGTLRTRPTAYARNLCGRRGIRLPSGQWLRPGYSSAGSVRRTPVFVQQTDNVALGARRFAGPLTFGRLNLDQYRRGFFRAELPRQIESNIERQMELSLPIHVYCG